MTRLKNRPPPPSRDLLTVPNDCLKSSRSTYREVKKKMNPFWSIVYFWEMTRFWWNFWWKSGPITSFFAHIFKSIGPVLRKLREKMHFFTFSKTSKNTYMTRKIHPPNYWHYGFSSYFGFGLKHSIAIFSAIQNVIWSRIDDFRLFWKLLDFPFLTCFLT